MAELRWGGSGDVGLADGWRAKTVYQPSRLYGANGLRAGLDGRIYVAQVAGSQVSAIDVSTGIIEAVAQTGGPIVAPDDLAFDSLGNMFVTELTEGRVSTLDTRGNYRVVQSGMPCANPITVYRDRIIAGECRMGGRILELDPKGGAARVILDNVPMPNACEVGPDGLLYIPVMGANEIWRVSLEGGEPQVVAKDLGVPDAVKFDSEGFIVSTQVATGDVLRINPNTGEKTKLANIAPGLDNLTFVGSRLFVSSISGQINEILSDGKVQSLVPDGFQWPMGLAIDSQGGLFIADGGYCHYGAKDSDRTCLGMLFSPGFPGFARGVVAANPGEWVVTTANGQVARYYPSEMRSEVICEGYDRLMGVDITTDGALAFAEYGTGRVHVLRSGESEIVAHGLEQPSGVAWAGPARLIVTDRSAGKLYSIEGSNISTLIDDLGSPEGLAIYEDAVFFVDSQRKSLCRFDLASGDLECIARDLPVGGPVGVEITQLGGVGDMAGPMTNFLGLAVDDAGAVFVSCDAIGTVMKFEPI
jgi:sugar lactone lactonase YvrE